MATLEDVRAIAIALPGVEESVGTQNGGPQWRVPSGVFVWERPLRRRDVDDLTADGRSIPGGEIVAVRTDGLDVQRALAESFPDAFFVVPHFEGYPAVLVRLDAVEPEQLREVITDAWLLKAPKRVARQWVAENVPPKE
ncbi:MmcQ/YjbR family DNA-binding protein [Micromonospora sp. DT81.3]|uniref:MmcQ/YjbR family DNA-binding protein n=1 Tax=Micromonospora sp. DT81.3 TaxID=3416523 RepID=UPI003CF59E36